MPYQLFHTITLRIVISILFTLLATFNHAQVSSFNQYNGASSSLNPAYIANIDKDQVTFISRLQWPGTRADIMMNNFSFNKSIPSINSSFGWATEYDINHEGTCNSMLSGIQYGYHVLFLDNYYLCPGIAINYENTIIDVNNFIYHYNPKDNYIQLPPGNIKSQSLKANFGLIFEAPASGWYIGLSIKNTQLMEMDGTQTVNINSLPKGTKTLQENPTYSLQAFDKILPLSRNSVLLLFANYEYVGKINYRVADSVNIKMVQPSYSYFMLQSDVYILRLGIFGLGYKYFSNNYGNIFGRIAFFFGTHDQYMIGYSFDTLPYISDDKIKTYSSNELYLKYKF
jgi:hypothetical protein